MDPIAPPLFDVKRIFFFENVLYILFFIISCAPREDVSHRLVIWDNNFGLN
jgi:hypothetical protein